MSTFLNLRVPHGSNSALHSQASFPDTQPFRWIGAPPEGEGKRAPFGLAEAGKSVLAPGVQRSLALPRGLCGAEIRGTGRVGWPRSSQEPGFCVNNELPPARIGGDSSPPLHRACWPTGSAPRDQEPWPSADTSPLPVWVGDQPQPLW